MNTPLISIITINFNNKSGLIKTIESVISQSFKDYEYIIIDGGSTDGGKEIINQYKEQFDYCVSEKDSGIYNAMNKGIKVAKGKYLYFLNSGDYLLNNNVLNEISSYLDGSDIVYGNVFLEKNNKRTLDKGFHKDNVTLLDMVKGTIYHISAFIQKSQFEKFGLYDESLKISSDWTWFVSSIIINSCSVKYIDLSIGVYDLTGISSTNYLLGEEERNGFLSKQFGPKIVEDYASFKDIDVKYGIVLKSTIIGTLIHYINSLMRRTL